MDNKKLINLIYILLGLLVFGVVYKITGDAVERYQEYFYFESARYLPQILAIVCGVVVSSVCIYNPKANEFMNEVVIELKKVTWPTRKETYAATIVVIITLIIMSVMLYAFDMLWGFLIKLMIG